VCGIVGIVSLGERPIDPASVKRMADTLAHRGPDDAGTAFFELGAPDGGRGASWCSFTDAEFRHHNEHLPVFGGDYCRAELARGQFSVGLGHRRLSILDLSHYGHQPMANSDRRFWTVFNGEIYNFKTLRDGLVDRGHAFRTGTDTEVILRLWEEHGPECLPMLDGMFSLAVYDRVSNTITLARDRFGVKPLYTAVTREFLVFASEPKAILASGLVPAAIDPGSLVEYFTFQNVFRRETIWQGIEILQPGEMLTVRPGHTTTAVEPRRYHAGFPAFDPAPVDAQDAAEQVADAFRAAVTRQLVSDVPVGSYLSGGMDSGSIVAVAGRTIPRLHTFTAGFDLTNVNGIEQGFDERRLAEQLSYLLQTEHYDVVLHAGDMPAAMDKLSWHMDDPRVGMCHQNWYVAKLASRFVKVCLAGTGGDELFAGYPWRYRRGLGASSLEQFDRAYFEYWHRLLPPEELPALFAPDLRGHGESAWASFEGVMHEAPAWEPDADLRDNLLHRALFFEFRTFLHGLLVTDDHISMAHSLEARVPILDNRLADIAWRLPPSVKADTAALLARPATEKIDSADGKKVLRRAMEQVLPREFVYQQKRGFSPPDENWYRGPSMDYIKSILFDRRTRERPWFDHAFVERCLHEHFEGRRNHRLMIWSLLSVEWIQRHFVDGDTAVPETTPAAVHAR
jgi:asparagine synthase (glutamine-hydrolysing)